MTAVTTTAFRVDLTFQIPTAIRGATFALFADEYKLPFLAPNTAAYAATVIEFLLPILRKRCFQATSLRATGCA